ncbi:gliding motility-associated peptidyl-prolyl isomerase GldI [Tenacibaculum aestuariivivum]|uniref:gliding motility-associated peptidyl-prolyl isomerase GldI n=1 Tax=Tenacibaculum aestuariivivum TaxID=2006131 RepID=UPI003AB4726F
MRFNINYLILFFLILVSCKEPQARRPKKQGTTNFYKDVIAKNKKMNALEKKRLENWISKDTVTKYKVSENGFWYTYKVKDSVNAPKVTTENTVLLSFDVSDINGNIIYKKQKRTYKVDKEDFIPALQDGIKLMKKGEIITFVIPSYRAFGVTGDGNKITVNQPIKSTVTLIEIK